jgi:DNA-binding NarL/FixJ family response regulator
MTHINLQLLDDHPMVLDGLQSMLAAAEDLNISGVFSSVMALHTAWAAGNIPDVLLLDIHLKDGDGLELCKALTKNHPSVKIIALTSIDQTPIIRQMLKNGAAGYVLKSADQADILMAIRTVANGGEYLHAEVQQQLLNEALLRPNPSKTYLPTLTRREKEVLTLIIEEKTTQEIANILFISTNTVETHRMNLIQKMGVKNVAGLVRVAIERGLV